MYKPHGYYRANKNTPYYTMGDLLVHLRENVNASSNAVFHHVVRDQVIRVPWKDLDPVSDSELLERI